MRRAVLIAVALAIAVAGWRSARKRSPAALVSGDADARVRLQTLDEIVASRNDNDPRLDTAFDGLSPETKRLFRRRYRELPPERRNERGTIVYLLGRNLREAEDWAFLRDVASEPPCLSLSDCSRRPPPGGGGGPGDAVTLAYPSLVALRQAQRALESASPPAEGRDVIAAGKASRSAAVARLAAKIERQLPR